MALFVRLIFGGAYHMFGGLIFGGKFEFQNRLGLPYSWKEIYRFCFVLLCKCNWGQFPITSPRGAHIWSGDLRKGFLRYEFGGAYIWRGLYMEGLIFGILRYLFLKLRLPFCHLLVYQISWTFQTAASPPMLDLRAGGSPCQKNYSGGSRGGARVPPLFLDQTVAREAEKIFFWNPPPPPPPLSKGLDDRATPLSQGLDPALDYTEFKTENANKILW